MQDDPDVALRPHGMPAPARDAHPLAVWRREHDVSIPKLADLLGVARYSIKRYEAGRMPVPPILDQIAILTGGQVTANDWLSPEAAKAVAKYRRKLAAKLVA